MKIALLTNYDAASALALHFLLARLPAESLSVFYTRSENPNLSQATSRRSSLSELAQFERSLPQLGSVFDLVDAQHVHNVNSPTDLARIKTTAPDLILSIRHMTILKPRVIELARLGVLNLHSGRLPEYQGVMATFWSMKNAEEIIGTTVHSIENESIDRGAVHGLSTQKVNYKRSYLWNTLSLYKQGCDDLVSAVEKTDQLGAKLTGQVQQEAGRYYSFPTEADIQSANFNLFNPTDSLAEFASVSEAVSNQLSG